MARQQWLIEADELEQTISQLMAMRDSLRHAAICPEPSHLSSSLTKQVGITP